MIELSYPILIYDNSCYSCSRLAQLVNALIHNRCLIVGHYTPLGKEIKKQIFPKGYDGLEMSWFIIDDHAYGGRSGLFRLMKYILLESKKEESQENKFDLTYCDTDCKTVKGIFFRLYSVITSYKKFSLLHN